jgi:bifunctional DNase/RNase
VKILESLGATLEKVEVTNLKESTFYAVLHMSLDGKKVEVDARPSDAIAVATAMKSPIFVSEKVLEEAAVG